MATAVVTFAQISNECEKDGLSDHNGERMAKEIAKSFGVQEDEVAILKLEKGWLQFVYPHKLRMVGNIPLTNSTSVAVRTANSKRAETINNFAQTKHASFFEAVDIGRKKDAATSKAERQKVIIQKLISVPVISGLAVTGVIQVCRKGVSGPEAGADFLPSDLQKLVQIAASLAKCFK